MSQPQVWLTAHMQIAMLIGLGCLVFGLLLLIIGWFFRDRRNVISAKNGGVVVGRDNLGTIITGGIGTDKTLGWVNIIGFFFVIVGIIVAILAWQYPVQP
jgi:hypothetical protein